MVKQLLNSVEGKLDTYKFPYKQNLSTEHAVVTLFHLMLKHLDKPKTIELNVLLFVIYFKIRSPVKVSYIVVYICCRVIMPSNG